MYSTHKLFDTGGMEIMDFDIISVITKDQNYVANRESDRTQGLSHSTLVKFQLLF